MIYFIVYFLAINIIGFFAMYLDKQNSIKGKSRTPEKTLFILALMLGGIGIYLGMYTFRHKTKKIKFTVFIPVIIVINLLCIYYMMFGDLINLTTLLNY